MFVHTYIHVCVMISTCFSDYSTTSRQFSVLFNLLFILFPRSHCIIPTANQQDLLRSFKSYSDVTMFHYTVPKEVFRATWQFAAFTDDPMCPPRQVFIHIKFGSYPVITASNEIFSTNESTRRNNNNDNDNGIVVTTTTTYQPTNVTVVPVYEPHPGDWFVAAYMSYWDEKIQQQGFGHKCQYSLGTVALWSQVDNIENISIDYQMRLRTTATTTYYKLRKAIYQQCSALKLWSYMCKCTIYSLNYTLRMQNNLKMLF